MIKFSHPIQELIMLDEQNPIRRISSSSREIALQSELERYIYGCAQGLSVIIASIDKAAFAIELIRQANSAIPDSIYTHAEQIEFAIENYFIRNGAIYDRALIFIGKLMDLGLADQAVGHELIVTNTHVIRYQLADALKSLKKISREHSVERNAIIHHRSYKDDSFNQVALIMNANSLMREAGKEAPFPDEAVAELTQALLEDHTAEFEAHQRKVRESIVNLLDIASAVYKIKRQAYLTS